jgi:HSP20 family protein
MKLIPRRQRDELSSLRTEFDDMLGRLFGDTSESLLPAALRRNGNMLPPLNVSETEKSWNISVDVPGMTEKDIQVELRGRTLVLSGERKWEEEKKGKEFRSVESQYGAFQRTVELPDNALGDPDALVATCKKGVLEVMIPKAEPTRSTKIAVKPG